MFKRNSPHHQILHQNPGQGYTTLFHIVFDQHPILRRHPHLLICSPPMQLIAKTVAQYYQHYNDFVNTCAFLEKNPNSLDASSELDKLLSGSTHSDKIFLISCEKRLSDNPNIKQEFTQGAIVNTLNQYLSELHLKNGPKISSRSRYDDSDYNSDSDAPS